MFRIRYLDGPSKSEFKEKDIRISPGFRMSFGHHADNTFRLDKADGVDAVNAVIRNDGSKEKPALVLVPRKAARISKQGSAYSEVKKSGVALEHGLRLKVGPHVFEFFDPDVKAPALKLVYESGPLKGRFKDKPLRVALHTVMTLGSKKEASIALPKDGGVEAAHAVIKKSYAGGVERLRIEGKQGAVTVGHDDGLRLHLISGRSAYLSHGQTVHVGPHRFRVVDADWQVIQDRLPVIEPFSATLRKRLSNAERQGRLSPGTVASLDRRFAGLSKRLGGHAVAHAYLQQVARSGEHHDTSETAAYYVQDALKAMEFQARNVVEPNVPTMGSFKTEGLTKDERKVLNAASEYFSGARVPREHRPYVYASNYLAHPQITNIVMNRWIRKQKNQEALSQAAVTLNAKIEAGLYPSVQRAVPSKDGFHMLHGAEHIFEGDILPGRGFRLGQPYTYDRELIEIHKKGKALPFLTQARQLAAKENDEWKIAQGLNEKIRVLPFLESEFPFGYRAGPATILLDNQGVCRHKAALLTMCLQEAGIKARYMRGNFDRYGHAWVEAWLNGRKYLLDPTHHGKMLDLDHPVAEVSRYSTPKRFNEVWRPYLKLKAA